MYWFTPVQLHKQHLRQVFNRLANAGLTLRGSKCKLGLDKVQYLGHVFSKDAMAPDTEKILEVQKWPTPTNVTEVWLMPYTLMSVHAVGIGAAFVRTGRSCDCLRQSQSHSTGKTVQCHRTGMFGCSLLPNTSGINSFFILIISHFNGSQLKKWRADCAGRWALALQ